MTQDWVTSSQAALIMSTNSGHTVSADYVRLLARSGKIATWTISSHVRLYSRSSVNVYRVKQRSPKAG